MEQVLGHTSTLCLPVEPQTAGAVMDVVAAVNNVDGCVHLDSANLSAGQILLVVDMVNVIVLDDGENAAQMSDDTSLSTIVDVTSSNDVGTNILLVPSFSLRLTDTVTLCLGTVFEFPFQPLVIIIWLFIFSKGDTGAFRMGDLAVLNNPAL